MIFYRLESLGEIGEEFGQKLFEGVKYNVDPDDRIVEKLRGCKEEMNVYITIPGIAVITLTGEARLFGLLLSLL